MDGIGHVAGALSGLTWPAGVEVVVDGSAVVAMDTAGAWLLHRTARALEHGGCVVTLRLRPEHERLFGIVISCGVVRAPAPARDHVGVAEMLGRKASRSADELHSFVRFIGQTAVTAVHALTGPLHVRWRQVLQNVQTAGFEALPTALLLAFSLGVVIAHEGSSLFQPFGAGVLVADLVGLATLRELAPMLTAIIAAARSGSAYAAQIGAMKITGEIDSLRAVGASPIEVLVLPRIAALAIALPLLTVAADVVAVAGAMVVARSELSIENGEFLERIARAIQPSDYLVGLVKAPIFGAIVAAIGCYQGLHVEDDANSVGRRTTVAVVQSMFLVIIADAFVIVLSKGVGF